MKTITVKFEIRDGFYLRHLEALGERLQEGLYIYDGCEDFLGILRFEDKELTKDDQL